MIDLFGIEITPKVDAGHIVIVASLLTAWLASRRKARDQQVTLPLRVEHVEAQNEIIISSLRDISARQLLIEQTANKTMHDVANTRTVASAIHKQTQNGKNHETPPADAK